jgi:lipopolysaccharide export system ATP-binding protein
MGLLVADCVGKRFGDRWVLRSATLRAEPGQLRALVGRNGCGKSTLLKIAAGLVNADTGIVRFDGRALLRPRLHRLAVAGVFLIPDVDFLSSSLTVGAHLEVMARSHARRETDDVVRGMRLAGLLDRRPWQLSGGERRRVEMALALVRRPRCLLADEPLRDSAPRDVETILGALRAMVASGCALIVTGHEVPALFEAADHVTWCTDGTTYELGPPPAAVRDERFVRHFLGPASPRPET